jgi:hypothetical protein
VHTIPNREPTELTAGDTWRWNRSLSSYPASDGWTLAYSLSGAHETVLTLTAAPAGNGYEVRASATETAEFTPGAYRMVGHVSKDGDRFPVYTGSLYVHPDPAAAVPALSHDERTLAIIDARLEGRFTRDMESYAIEGQAVTRIPIAELVRLQGIYRARVERARHPRSLGQRVEVWFVPS